MCGVQGEGLYIAKTAVTKCGSRKENIGAPIN